ncbi:MAG: SIS domain-containing protein, partial [Terriglobia bacterium]
MNTTAAKPGGHSEAEILSQPCCWRECLGILKTSGQVEKALDIAAPAREWLFIGCGSSYYIALAAAASFTALAAPRRARAAPASELILFPNLVLGGETPPQPVLISRSGRTSEVLQAARYLEGKGIRTLAISCAPGEALEKIASATLCLPPADEKSTVMTRSFTSMLLGLQFLAGKAGNQQEFLDSLDAIPVAAEKLVKDLARRVQEFVSSHEFADYVYLGQGPLYGLACEAALKVNEMSCSYAQSFHTLEFRHGPKSIVGREVLTGFFLSETGGTPEVEVLEEMKGLGGTTLAVTSRSNERVRRSADFLVEVGADLPEYARLAPALIAGQLLGLYTGLK